MASRERHSHRDVAWRSDGQEAAQHAALAVLVAFDSRCSVYLRSRLDACKEAAHYVHLFPSPAVQLHYGRDQGERQAKATSTSSDSKINYLALGIADVQMIDSVVGVAVAGMTAKQGEMVEGRKALVTSQTACMAGLRAGTLPSGRVALSR
eukprot:m.187336 g.187336  ORF g.187336 m.187336 type:complete len:151 (-) comp53574_c0_seq18:952-1404(-)